MEEKKRSGVHKRSILIIPFVLVFCILGMVVFFVSNKISVQMSEAAIDNLSERLDLISNTIETIIKQEADFQKMIAQEIAYSQEPGEYILSYEKNSTMVKLSLILSGEKEGISNTGEVFTDEGLNFSGGKKADGMPVSASYINDMGTWAYTIKCPVVKNNQEIAALYVEYIYDSFDYALPGRFYNKEAKLYLMDAISERMVLKPKGIGERDAGHINLADFYTANRIQEQNIQEGIAEAIKEGKDVMFYHDIRKEDSLIYMWSVNDGVVYLVGYVPVQAIQREGDAVNQNIYIVVIAVLVAFFACCLFYFLFEKQHERLRKEREAERELYNKQLQEALQTAQAANQSKTMFLSNMSHDIRTPMNAILGFAALLGRYADDPKQVREYTKKITVSGQHLLGLINDILDISKIESGKAVLSIGEFALKDMISSIDAIIRPAAKGKNQNFEITVTGIRNEHLLGDETRINQILINLLSNAVKYTQTGGSIWLRIIGLEQRSGQYEHIRIEVEDNGYGMTPEYLEKIFDAFTRAENSTTNKVQGTGLGMAITKNIVELMGGTIEVTSEVGAGSLFAVELELRIPDRKADERFWEQRGISRILVVDDNEDNCQAVQLLMQGLGIRIDAAYSGEEALRMRKAACEAGEDYHVILLDWKMPGIDGVETARQLRAVTSEHIPILLLTAYDWDEIQEEAAEAGIDGFLQKPFLKTAFQEKILELSAEPDTNEESAAGAEAGILEGKHFLVAEDNEINSEILAEILSIEGASCEVVENGQLAVERYKQTKPGSFDAILMDVQMPVMNGYEATRAIRSLEGECAERIPIIAMTANAFAEDVKDAMDAGMTAHIAKPIDIEVLKRTIMQCM